MASSGRLRGSSSLYLRQHAEQPVDWFPWGYEAFAEARRRDCPVFVSVGYSSCHWCHVMAAESFDDEGLASALNESFVSIKVDRDEHPDVDDTLITACQIANGHAGWPLSVFMTADKEPFFVGTYFPLKGRGDQPGFAQIVASLAHSWKSDHDELLSVAGEFAGAIRQVLARPVPSSSGQSVLELAALCVGALADDYDAENGGFGDAPKFPPYPSLWFLQSVERSNQLNGEIVTAALGMAEGTAAAISAGGIHDHVGGGLHRYSTDAHWHLPHFEKMLGDNSMAVALGMGSPSALCESFGLSNGMFGSTLDAGAGGVEGAPYVWSLAEIEAILGSNASAFCTAFGVTKEGNYFDEATRNKTGLNVLHLETAGQFKSELAALKEVRDRKVQPTLDEKAIAALNGMAAWALAPKDPAAAVKCLTAWLDVSQEGLPHQVVDRRAYGLPYLDDLAWMALAGLALKDSDPRFEEWSYQLVDQALLDHVNPSGGFYTSSLKHDSPLGRQMSVMDGPVPSANAIILEALFQQGRTEVAEYHLSKLLGWAERLPTACAALLKVALDHAPGISTRLNRGKELSISLDPVSLILDADGFAYTSLLVDIPPGHHINSYDPPAKWLTATTVRVSGALGEAGFPEGEGDYSGLLEVPLRLMPKGNQRDFEVTLTYQLCTETECFEPQTSSVSGVIVGRREG